jgi:D-beta-D-heptose 7-phosphate kinase/D-beta-D-heptose 1-phosphate adenosyltransferase
MELNVKGTIVVVGDVMLDVYITGRAHKISPEAPVPVVRVESRTATLGGAGNVALNLAKLGCKTRLFGVRGHDEAGNRLIALLNENGIENKLTAVRSFMTTVKTRIRAHSQQLLRYDDEAYFGEELKYDEIVKDDVVGVIVSDYAKGVITDDLISSVIQKCENKGITVFVDPKREGWSRYCGATVVKPNITELEKAAGKDIQRSDVAEVAQHMKNLFRFDSMLVTMGADGMLLIADGAAPQHIVTNAKAVFDVTGAGDTVIATLAACMCHGYSLYHSAIVANTAAGIVVGKVGTSPVTLNELNAALFGEVKC